MTEKEAIARGWQKVKCGCCAGIKWGGEYPRPCEQCNVYGEFWVSPGRRTALWPGGPFTGSLPKDDNEGHNPSH